MKIKQKLMLGFIGISMLSVSVAFVSIWQNKNIQMITERGVYRSIEQLRDVYTLMESMEHMELAAGDQLFKDLDLGDRRADYFYEKERQVKCYQKYSEESCPHVAPLLAIYHKNLKKYQDTIERAFELFRQKAPLEEIKAKAREASYYVKIAHDQGLKPIINHVYEKHIEKAKQDIVEEINRMIVSTMAISFIALFLAVVLGWGVSRSISKPIIKLRDAAVAVSEGNFDTKVESKSKDEIGILAQAFNSMAESLKTLMKKKKEFLSAEAAISAEKKKAQELAFLNKELMLNELGLKEMQKKLEKKMEELEKFNKFSIGREKKMIEMKKEINELLKELGRDPRYEQ